MMVLHRRANNLKCLDLKAVQQGRSRRGRLRSRSKLSEDLTFFISALA